MGLDSSYRLYLGTEDGTRTAVLGDGQAVVVAEGLPGQAVRAISPSPVTPEEAFVGCGVRGSGLYRTTDGGHTYTSFGFDDEWVWGLSRHPTDPEKLYVGTEPPGLWVSTDSGGSFERVDGIETLPSRESWFFSTSRSRLATSTASVSTPTDRSRCSRASNTVPSSTHGTVA